MAKTRGETLKPITVFYEGVEMTIPDLARAHNKDPEVVRDRIRRGWDIHRAVSEPVKDQSIKRYEWRGKLYTAKELAKLKGDCSASTMYHRLEVMSAEEAMARPVQKRARVVPSTKKKKEPDPMRKFVDTRPCRKCQYHGTLGNSESSGVYCDYIGVKQHRRPCPPPPLCTVRVEGPSLVKKMAQKMKGARVWVN